MVPEARKEWIYLLPSLNFVRGHLPQVKTINNNKNNNRHYYLFIRSFIRYFYSEVLLSHKIRLTETPTNSCPNAAKNFSLFLR